MARWFKLFEEVEAAREGMPLTYFEFTALGILRVFQKAKPDVVILGNRFGRKARCD